VLWHLFNEELSAGEHDDVFVKVRKPDQFFIGGVEIKLLYGSLILMSWHNLARQKKSFGIHKVPDFN